jgi:hypothetical protein
MVPTGHIFGAFPMSVAAYELLDHETNDHAREQAAQQKICIACGALQSADGTLPCGHDNDL